MACLEMYSSPNQNSDHKSLSCAPMSPRISFSNDFVESNHSQSTHPQMIKPREAPASSDFEFSVTNYSMMSADELFFKGRLLPFKDCCANQLQKPTTLREELLVEDDDDGGGGGGAFSLRPFKGSHRWKEILGLRKTETGSRKPVKSDGFWGRKPGLNHGQSGWVMEGQVAEMWNLGCDKNG
ncbi:hypothetical protein U1Q18_011860 [Sarracenia purpurea var. burkii]